MTPAYWVAIGVAVGALFVLAVVTAGTGRRARRLAAMAISPAVRSEVEALQGRINALQDDLAGLQLRVQMAQERAKAISETRSRA